MENANYCNNKEREKVLEGQLEESAWWPLFALLAILGGLLFWEELSPLPQIPIQVVGLGALGLLFGGIALWVIFLARD